MCVGGRGGGGNVMEGRRRGAQKLNKIKKSWGCGGGGGG